MLQESLRSATASAWSYEKVNVYTVSFENNITTPNSILVAPRRRRAAPQLHGALFIHLFMVSHTGAAEDRTASALKVAKDV